MTISTTDSSIAYNGNSVTLAFAVPFRFLVDADLTVTLRSSAGVESTLVLNTNYTLTGANDDAGGTLTMVVAPATGERLVIRRVVGITQETDYITGDSFPAEAHERALDRLTMISQQLKSDLARCIQFPVSDTASPEIPTSANRANKFAAYDADGNATVASGTALSGVTITPFAETLVGRGTAALMRGDLGATAIGDALFTAANPAAARQTIGAIDQTSRNAVINGDFSSDQEYAGGSQTVTAGAAFKSVADCWYGICSGANVTAQRITQSDNTYRLRFTGAAGVTLAAAGHRIRSEEVAARRMVGAKASIGVLLSSSSLTSITWRLYRANSLNSFGTRASPTRTLIQSGTFTINSTETRYTVTTSAVLPTEAANGLEIEFEGGALLASQTLTTGEVQVEKSDVPTPFETVPEIETLIRAQTQISTSYAKGTAVGTATVDGAYIAYQTVASTNSALVNIAFPQPMVATPTMTYYNPVTGGTGTWRTGGGANEALSNASITPNNKKIVVANNNTALTVGTTLYGHWMAKAYPF